MRVAKCLDKGIAGPVKKLLEDEMPGPEWQPPPTDKSNYHHRESDYSVRPAHEDDCHDRHVDVQDKKGNRKWRGRLDEEGNPVYEPKRR
jgi:hypothetical protein